MLTRTPNFLLERTLTELNAGESEELIAGEDMGIALCQSVLYNPMVNTEIPCKRALLGSALRVLSSD